MSARLKPIPNPPSAELRIAPESKPAVMTELEVMDAMRIPPCATLQARTRAFDRIFHLANRMLRSKGKPAMTRTAMPRLGRFVYRSSVVEELMTALEC